MNERLLTEELQENAINILEASDHDSGKTYLTEANEVTSITLKAVGELLKSKRAGRTMPDGKMALVKEIPDKNWVCFLTDDDIDRLENGKMLEEGK